MYSKSTLNFCYLCVHKMWHHYSESKDKSMYRCLQRLVQGMFAEVNVTLIRGVLIFQKWWCRIIWMLVELLSTIVYLHIRHISLLFWEPATEKLQPVYICGHTSNSQLPKDAKEHRKAHERTHLKYFLKQHSPLFSPRVRPN